MKLTPPRPGEDYTIHNVSGQTVQGDAVSRFLVHGPPPHPSTGIGCDTKEAAVSKGRELAKAAGVSVWYVEDGTTPVWRPEGTFRKPDLFMKEVEELDVQVDRVIEASNGLSGNELVALLPRIRRSVEKLNQSFPVVPPAQ